MDVRTRHRLNLVFLATPVGLWLARRAGVPLRTDEVHGVRVAHPYPARFPAPTRTAITFGDVVLLRADVRTHPHLLDHEARHSVQWATHLGVLGYPAAYGVASVRSWLRTGDLALANRFEVAAGLVDGGYLAPGQAPPPPRPLRRRLTGWLSRRSRRPARP